MKIYTDYSNYRKAQTEAKTYILKDIKEFEDSIRTS